MFGLDRFILKIVGLVMGIIALALVLICAVVTIGCVPEKPGLLSQEQAALAQKNNIDTSQQDNDQDNSIVIELAAGSGEAAGTEEVLTEIVTERSVAEDAVRLVRARALERERVIFAEAQLKEKVIRAAEEKWRLMVWVLGIGAVVVSLMALFVRSPIDRRVSREQ